MIRLCDPLGENCSDVPSPGLWQHLCILIPKGPQTDGSRDKSGQRQLFRSMKTRHRFFLSRHDIKLFSCFISLGPWKAYKKHSWGTHISNANKGNYPIMWREVRHQTSPALYHSVDHWSSSSQMCTDAPSESRSMKPGTEGLKGFSDNIRE